MLMLIFKSDIIFFFYFVLDTKGSFKLEADIVPLTLCILVDIPIHIDTIAMGLSIIGRISNV